MADNYIIARVDKDPGEPEYLVMVATTQTEEQARKAGEKYAGLSPGATFFLFERKAKVSGSVTTKWT
jgi:hypothetical protein